MNDNNNRTNHSHKTIAGQGIVILLGALLAGCGGGGGSSPPPVSPGPAPAPVPPPPPTSTVPPLASPAIDLASINRVGVDHWPAHDSSTGGQGQAVSGIECIAGMPDDYHIHAHLSIFLNGEQLTIPEEIGVVNSVSPTCYYALHTHDLHGKLHVEAATPADYTLGQFFQIWGRSLTNTDIGGITGLPVVLYTVDSSNVVTEVPDTDWANIEIASHLQIVIVIGTPITEIPNYTWTGD